MSTRRLVQVVLGVVAAGLVAWAVTLGLERLVDRPASTPVATPEPVLAPATGSITATLFYGASDAQALVPVRREVPFADDLVAQGREILEAQLQPPADAYLSVIPAGTTLRAFYVTERGEAFVDLSPEISTAHPGGSFTELLTVYAIVNAVTANLPAVQRVQILVEGREVDTIAGHVDVRRPLVRDDTLVRDQAD